jgi:putative tricarboxylic transport membrane protein
MRNLVTLRNLFSLFLIAWFAYGFWEAREYAFLAKIFPLYVSLILLICAVINLVKENYPQVRQALTDATPTQSSSDLSSQWDIPMSLVWRRFAFFVSLILVLYVATFIIGYPVSITLFIFLFYRFVTKTSYPAAGIAAAAGLGFLALASKVLNMYWPEGLITLPWPLG